MEGNWKQGRAQQTVSWCISKLEEKVSIVRGETSRHKNYTLLKKHWSLETTLESHWKSRFDDTDSRWARPSFFQVRGFSRICNINKPIEKIFNAHQQEWFSALVGKNSMEYVFEQT